VRGEIIIHLRYFEILRFAQNDKEIDRRETVDGRRMSVLILYNSFPVSRLPSTEYRESS